MIILDTVNWMKIKEVNSKVALNPATGTISKLLGLRIFFGDLTFFYVLEN